MADLKEELAGLRLEREPPPPIPAGDGSVGSCWPFSSSQPAAERGGGSPASAPSRSRSPQCSTRQAGTQAAVLNATGYVTARRRATVSSKITGKVVEVNIEEGMAVAEGQVLARLDAETQRAAVALTQAQAEAARRNVQRKRGAPQRSAHQPRASHKARRRRLFDRCRSRRGSCGR